jgi:hypothetical protein
MRKLRNLSPKRHGELTNIIRVAIDVTDGTPLLRATEAGVFVVCRLGLSDVCMMEDAEPVVPLRFIHGGRHDDCSSQ